MIRCPSRQSLLFLASGVRLSSHIACTINKAEDWSQIRFRRTLQVGHHRTSVIQAKYAWTQPDTRPLVGRLAWFIHFHYIWGVNPVWIRFSCHHLWVAGALSKRFSELFLPKKFEEIAKTRQSTIGSAYTSCIRQILLYT
jgi:hypothetical protein